MINTLKTTLHDCDNNIIMTSFRIDTVHAPLIDGAGSKKILYSGVQSFTCEFCCNSDSIGFFFTDNHQPKMTIMDKTFLLIPINVCINGDIACVEASAFLENKGE